VDFEHFFERATENRPYPYQVRLALSNSFPSLLDVPTGLGKTAAAILAWLYRRRFAEDPIRRQTPRRLVYCLPMRTLVQQTFESAKRWLSNLELLSEPGQGRVSVHLLMGGELDEAWQRHPETDCVLIGTQDMLLSRGLNRGYAMSRYRWPMHFGLLNNDCLWVMDETQLMGVGVETTAQLAALREKLGTHGNTNSLWMSATLGEAQLETVDHPKPPSGWQFEKLQEDDLGKLEVRQRIQACKTVQSPALSLAKENAEAYPIELAATALRHHHDGTLTLVVVNRVARAQDVYEELLKQGRSSDNTGLVHSRFREGDRRKQEKILFGDGDRIVVATQAVEAGVDVSARNLITELAPWPSLVQRFGRCNRYGEYKEAGVFWVNIETERDRDDLAMPYRPEDLRRAREVLKDLTDVAPQRLPSLPEPFIIRPVLRRKDLLDLFDTTPDLCGNDLDISRYVRDAEDTDVQMFWREIANENPPLDLPEASREELVRVSIGGFRLFLKKRKGKGRVWRWDPLEERWDVASEARPGQTYLIDRVSGGYSDQLGWTGNQADVPSLTQPKPAEPPDGNASDKQTFIGRWVDLSSHLSHVAEQARLLVSQLEVSVDLAAALTSAARWHDVGKAHSCFQDMLRKTGIPPNSETVWAKSASQQGRCARKGFRHELASALAWLQVASTDKAHKDLVAYLIAAHHGRVRLSIRSLPNETEPPEPGTMFARGIWHGESVPAVSLGNGETMMPVSLDMSFMQMGDGPLGESWMARMLSLRADPLIGPFRLAYWETLLRVADWRASELERQRHE
jgi:CRISPR-associated endonuclease/helicase Cas3